MTTFSKDTIKLIRRALLPSFPGPAGDGYVCQAAPSNLYLPRHIQPGGSKLIMWFLFVQLVLQSLTAASNGASREQG